MTNTQQFDELKHRIWQIANEVCGAVDEWGFNQDVLDTLFYRMEKVAAGNHPLSVSSHVEAQDTRAVIKLTKLN